MLLKADGFSYIETLLATGIVLFAMAIALTFFVDFGSAINTESTTLATQGTGRRVVDELAINIQQVGFGVDRPHRFNSAVWQRALVYGGSHILAFNADLSPGIGPIDDSQTLSFPDAAAYKGEGASSSTAGAETYVYTLDGNGNGTIEGSDRVQVASGSYNPAAETENPLDFGVFRRVYGYNGSDYGGNLEPLAGRLFTNAVADADYPDGSSPAPLFVYWLSEDLDGDGYLSPQECVNDVVDTCPPSASRSPMLYLWGDTDFDGALSESEKDALRTTPVASPGWSKNPLVSGGSYLSTTLSTSVDPTDPNAYEIEVGDGSKLGPGYQVQIGSGGSAERFTVVEVSTTSTPHVAQLAAFPTVAHAIGAPVQVLPETLLKATRMVELTFTAIADRRDVIDGAKVAGRIGLRGSDGLDYRVTQYRRKVEMANTATTALAGP